MGRAILFGFLCFFTACKTPPAPPETLQAETLEQALWRAGASLYDEKSFAQFKLALKLGKERLSREKAKFGWFRNYAPIQTEFQDVLKRGEELLLRVEGLKTSKTKNYVERSATLAARTDGLKRMTDYFNENGAARKCLSQAEIKLGEAALLIKKEEFEEAGSKLAGSESFVRQAEQAIARVLSRYLDRRELNKWRRWAEKTVAESKENGTTAFLVDKLEQKLTVYKKGVAAGQYNIGLGRNGLSDKLYSGDEATPEGFYTVVQKIPASSFYKALLINYPNEEDKKAFAAAKKKGLVPSWAGIGGYIEIHGGGKNSLTKGCIGLENENMDEIYKDAEIGSVVTIVGTVSTENTILAEIKKFEKNG